MGVQVPIRSSSAGYREGLVSQLRICGLNSAGRVLSLQVRSRRFEPVSPYQLQQTDKALAHETGRWDASGLVVLHISLAQLAEH